MRWPPLAGSRLLLSIALLSTALTAGCTSPSGPAAVDPISAQAAYDELSSLARDWEPDAKLVLLSGVEAPEGSPATREVPAGDGRSQPNAPVDPQVGDGRAPTWTGMFYSAAANASRTYQYVGGELRDHGESPRGQGTPRVMANWSVDSTQAVGVALGNASFRQVALSSDGMVAITLGMQDGDAAWLTIARTPGGGEHVELLVDATDGSLLRSNR